MTEVRRLGRIPYAEAHALQRALVEQRAAGEIEDVLLVCEHDPVYTVGRRRGAEANLLAVGDVPVVEVERGGDVTFHGPGQVVLYPIVQLEGAGRDLHAHLHRLEDVMIAACAAVGVEGLRDARNTGCWAGVGTPSRVKKVGSVGIACRRWVTWHGLALNVDTDLAWFRRVNPCGFEASVMTTLAEAAGRPVSRAVIEEALVDAFLRGA